MDRIAIVGAGAMGSLFAARLAEAGAAVAAIDVDLARLATIAAEGITLADDQGARSVSVAAGPAAAIAGPVDLVIIFTKTLHTEAAARSVAHLAAGGAHALTLQNGIGNAEAIAAVFGPERTLIGATDLPADFTPPGRVSSHGAGHVWLGALQPQGQTAVAAVIERFNAAGLNAVADPQVMARIWEKLAFNAALNSLATVSGFTVGQMNSAPGRRIALAVADEVAAVAAARGLALDRAAMRAKIGHALDHHGDHKASMLQDRLAGRPTEIEAINGAVVRAGEAAGVATPVTATLADLVRMVTRQESGSPPTSGQAGARHYP